MPYSAMTKQGEPGKHAEAVRQAASDVRQKLPGIPCSETEVRRILARNSHIDLVISKPDPENKELTLGLPGIRPVLLAAWGERPTYPRHNAADKPRRKKRLKGSPFVPD